MNASINVEHAMQNRRYEPTVLAEDGETLGMMAMSPATALLESAGRVLGGSGIEPTGFCGSNWDHWQVPQTNC
jgi:hypothetical protein